MDKFIIRVSIIGIAAYLILCYMAEFLWQVNLWRQSYYLLFEYCVCLCISKHGVYHCKYIKWTAYAILIEDTIATTDVMFDYMPNVLFAIVQPTIITVGILTTTILAVRHYIRVKRIKKIWR